ncbi:non-structural maintenance of chromosomes element 3 homolog [Anticarsia gemmatalis]|uniref:non-structural maintenance of chromosomes element 3 homolog n=1 Tax=Anticarsia gemmatalis TaxID=129554 RepID=UPI003F768DAF
MSQRRANRSRGGDTDDVAGLEDSIKECVRFILCKEGSKIPIKRGEILKHLSTVCQTATNLVNIVIIEANKVLKNVYGYKLVQVEAKSGIQYIVVLNEECESLLSTVTEEHHRKLLVAALMHIFMSGAPVKEEEMWKFLAEAGLLEESDNVSRKLLTITFTRQMYLQYSKVGEGDLARFVFQWGQRAVEEVPKLFLLNKMGEAFEKSPDHWCEQYKEATEETSET